MQWAEKGNGFSPSHHQQLFWAEGRQCLLEFYTLAQARVLSFVPAQPFGYAISRWVQLLNLGERIKKAGHGQKGTGDDMFVLRVCGVSIG